MKRIIIDKDFKNKNFKKEDLVMAINENKNDFLIFSIGKITKTFILINKCYSGDKEFKSLSEIMLKLNKKVSFETLRKDLNYFKLNKKEQEYYKNLITLKELEK